MPALTPIDKAPIAHIRSVLKVLEEAFPPAMHQGVARANEDPINVLRMLDFEAGRQDVIARLKDSIERRG